MAEPTDVQRAKAALRELSGLSRYHDEDLRTVLDSHDRLTRELREVRERWDMAIGEYRNACDREVSDLRAKLAAAARDHSKCCTRSTGIDGSITAGTGTLDENGYWSEPCDECALRSNFREAQAQLAELQRENERLRKR